MTEYISKKEAINALINKGQRTKRYKIGETWELNLMEITEAIDSIPPEDVQPVNENAPRHCSYCGADMTGGAEVDTFAVENLCKELKEAKRLLKAALVDMNNGGCNSNCYKCKYCGVCDYSKRFTWKLTDEAENLIGGSENG